MPEFQTFFTPARLDEFWYYVKWLLFYVAPMIMIMTAAGAISLLVVIMKKSFANTDQVGKQEKDDDYEIRRY
ncbi:hypothetical protein GGR02_001403 [Anoxybacillus voinovskiensis]|uniref:Uncharacterized protein n=1 Tax=Anoxybacteroides voinovskiense TaxID=230470 RepID=A0A840DK14_9BACL|nr:hypothetical protein [Anoxybacillus voinovskiensis]MBB4073641.1 hypothetical protein [Anoxybacillus voinovskiensis]GGJ63401.1 hypothetical protein GCM10008982_10790 [Anoxybacillus voinovskiensis]